MADRILYLLDKDELCDQMGIEAKPYPERFSCERVLREIESLYRELLKPGTTKKVISYTTSTEEISEME